MAMKKLDCRRSLVCSMVALVFLVTACTELDAEIASTGQLLDATAEGLGLHPMTPTNAHWQPCSLYINANDGRAECATLEMPLFWDNPDDFRTTSVFVKRVRALSGVAQKQIWMLSMMGGFDFQAALDYFHYAFPTADIYTFDHRGVGNSDALVCPDQEAIASDGGETITENEIRDCIDHLTLVYGDALGAYGTTFAAMDLAALIDASGEADQDVILYGASYGSYLVQRYLQFFPDQSDAIVLECIAPPDFSTKLDDLFGNLVGRHLLSLCADDEICSQKLGPNPHQTVRALYQKIANGHCPELGLDKAALQFASLRLLHNQTTASLLMPMFYRMDRCNESDRAALNRFWNVALFGGPSPTSLGYHHQALHFNVRYSELWAHPLYDLFNLDRLYLKLEQRCLFCFGQGPMHASNYELWPRYNDPHDNQWAMTDQPMLMFQGMMDPYTPYPQSRSVALNYDGPGQNYLAFRYAGHQVVGASPYLTENGVGYCAAELLMGFIHDPTAAIDASCVSRVLPHNFAGDPATSQFFFNTPDYWENE